MLKRLQLVSRQTSWQVDIFKVKNCVLVFHCVDHSDWYHDLFLKSSTKTSERLARCGESSLSKRWLSFMGQEMLHLPFLV